jgi:molybdate transport system substrate-binding protein
MNNRIVSAITLLLLSVVPLPAGGSDEAVGTGEVPGTDEKVLTVFAAASLTDVMSELAVGYSSRTGVSIRINPAASGTLARQIELGAEADLYFSASRRWIDYVDDAGLVDRRAVVARNSLVVVVPEDSPVDRITMSRGEALPEWLSGRVAIGDPDYVPAGAYAAQALTWFGWYDQIRESMILTTDVRSALRVVELGEADVGIVYRTDAMQSSKVRVAGEFPEESHDPVSYFVAVLVDADDAANGFFDFVTSDPEAVATFREHGFTHVEPDE